MGITDPPLLRLVEADIAAVFLGGDGAVVLGNGLVDQAASRAQSKSIRAIAAYRFMGKPPFLELLSFYHRNAPVVNG